MPKKYNKAEVNLWSLNISLIAMIVLTIGLSIALIQRFNSQRLIAFEDSIVQYYLAPEKQAVSILQIIEETRNQLTNAPNFTQKLAIISRFKNSLEKRVSQINSMFVQKNKDQYRLIEKDFDELLRKIEREIKAAEKEHKYSLQQFDSTEKLLVNSIEKLRQLDKSELETLLLKSEMTFQKNNNYVLALVMLIIFISLLALLMNKSIYRKKMKAKDDEIYANLQKENDFRSVVQNSNESILIVVNEEIVFINKNFLSLLNTKDYQVKPHSVYDLFLRNEVEGLKIQILRCLRGSESLHPMQLSLAVSGGEGLNVEAQFSLISWRGENAVCILLNEQSIEKNEFYDLEQKANIIDEIHGSIVSTDLRGRIRTWNKGAEELFGYSFKEAKLKNFSMLYPENEQAFLQNKLILPLYEYLNIDKDVQLQRKTGELFYAYLSLSLIHDAEGKPSGMVAFIADISGRKKAESELVTERESLDGLVKSKTIELRESLINLENENKRRIVTQASLIKAKNEAEKANKMKSQFLSRISHELRTPLNAILGFSQLLECEELDEEHQGMVSEISIAGNHLINIINEVLELAKIESGKAKVVIEDIYIKDIIRDCMSIVKMQPQAKSINFEDMTEAKENFILRADKTKIREVLLNLLTNAVKYNRQDGTVTVDYKITDYNMLRLSVIDTGNGISADNLNVLFEPFNRLGAEYTEIEGTGIGLTISKELMALMHGNIGVNTEVGVGSQFWIDCQVSTSMSHELVITEKPTLNMQGSKHTILCIEDNSANRRLIEQIIKRKTQFGIEFSLNAEDGIEKACEHPPSLILMDINLPGMDGFEALKHIQNTRELKHIPVIAISATATTEHLEKGLQAGFKYYITKPIAADELVNKIISTINMEKRQAS